ncbi:hypothetical protein EUX98_g8227, partial [Antrodiella citrinella]
MPASFGNSTVPAVRSPLGQECPLSVAPLLPSPQINSNKPGSPLGATNPFNFQAPGLGRDEPTTASSDPRTEAEVSDERRHEHSAHNPFYHADQGSASAAEMSYFPTVHQFTDPQDILTEPDTVLPATFGTNPAITNPLFSDETTESEDLTDFDTEGYSTLEKIYLFSRSRVGFHRVFIAKSLGTLLRGEGGSLVSTGPPQDDEGQYPPTLDTISPDEAVQYVLPLLNGLAMDDETPDEAVKEALASELVPIIWWFVTRCKLVDEEVDASDYPQYFDEEMLVRLHDATPDTAYSHLTPPAESEHSEFESSGQTSPEVLHSMSSPDSTRHGHHNPLTILAHSNPLTSPHNHNIAPVHPLPPSQAHTPDHPSPLSHRSPSDPEAEAGTPADEPALISVQSFTPILGTLLLSANAHVGGPARYAVVELLRRVRKADDFEHHTSTQLPADPSVHPLEDEEDEEQYSELGLFGEEQRRLFEREMIHQVVIGMGRLDLPEEVADGEPTSGSGLTTAAATPLAGGHSPHHAHRSSPGNDSYFPTVAPSHNEGLHGHRTSPAIVSPTASTTSLNIVVPPPVTSFADFQASGLLSPPLEINASPALSSPFMNAAPSPFMSPSPALSAVSSFSSTPSLLSNYTTPSSPATSVASTSSALPVPSSFHLAPVPPGDAQVYSHSGSPAAVTTGTWVPPRSPGDLPVGEEEDRQRFGSGLEANVTYVTNWVGEEDADLNEEAAVGRLSSMSLMAAVTASVTMSDEHQAAFVTEVERVSTDPVYWVRREASFVVGALAKVVPSEVVTASLLPLFELLCHDTVWQVRHSALFALPAILSRLPSDEKHKLALKVMLPMSKDEAPTVRSGVLEALAEVMYTFHMDAAGPPDELTRLFIGIRDGDTQRRPRLEPVLSAASMSWSEFMAMATANAQPEDSYDIYDDQTRPLVCAFNFP